MKRALAIFTLVLAVLSAGTGAKDKPEKSDKKSDKKAEKEKAEAAAAVKLEGYEAFRYVRGRNIFDPSRRGLKLETSNAVPAPVTKRSRALMLTGTMVTEGRALAFFGGVDTNRVIPIGETVAGFKLTAIAPAQVSLERDGQATVLGVGRQIALEGSESGTVMDGVGVPATLPAAPAAAGAPSGPSALPSAPPPTGDDKNEILRRMMERRAKEMGQ
jgi:hypothetical protein